MAACRPERDKIGMAVDTMTAQFAPTTLICVIRVLPRFLYLLRPSLQKESCSMSKRICWPVHRQVSPLGFVLRGGIYLLLISGLIAPPVVHAQQARPPAVREAARALELWDPLSIEQQVSRLIITTRERQVSQTVYTAMIGSGICLFAGTGQIQLTGIREILILNRFRGSGWVFEGGKSACQSVAQAPAGRANVLLLGQSHMYTSSIDGPIE